MAEYDVIPGVSSASADSVLLPLEAAGCTAIRYSKPLLESIRRRAVDKFLSIPRGGLEIGGLLFGRTHEGVIEILTSEDFPIEYSFGPSYALSERDEKTLGQRLDQFPIESEDESLELIGWWHSHTRSGVELSEEDLRIHQMFFAGERTIALILKPFKFDPAQVAVYMPNAGTNPLSVACRFEVGVSKAQDAEAKPSEDLVSKIAQAEPAADITPVVIESVFIQPSKKRSLRAASALALVMLSAFGLFALGARTWGSKAPQPEPQPLGLTLSQPASSTVANELILRWDRNADVLQSNVGGELVIVDGSKVTRIPLSVDSLNSGTLAYVRQSSKVEVRLRARSKNNQLQEAVAHFVGPDPTPATPAADVADAVVAPTPSSNSIEVERMKAELLRLNDELLRARATSKPAESTPVKLAQMPQPAPMATRQRAASAPVPSQITIPPPTVVVSTPISAAPITIPSIPTPAQAPPPPAVSPARVAAKPVTTALTRGRAIWTGMLPRGSILLVDGHRPSAGALTGRMPGVPSRMRIYPADLAESGIVVYTQESKQRVETPSAANGWNLTTYRPEAKRSRDITVMETPSTANNWQRLMIRSEQRAVSMLLIEWEEVSR